MSFELSGKLVEKYDVQQVSEKFKKREFVVEATDGNLQYPELIKFQLVQDKCDLLDNFQLNDEVKVSFNIKGRKWEKEGKVNYFTNLDAWRMEKVSGASTDDVPPISTYSDSDVPADDDDLPF